MKDGVTHRFDNSMSLHDVFNLLAEIEVAAITINRKVLVRARRKLLEYTAKSFGLDTFRLGIFPIYPALLLRRVETSRGIVEDDTVDTLTIK